MNREEFLRQLELLLTGISEEERADAMTFYRSYFEDAGEENEASIIEELGSPQKVAESIRKNLGLGTESGGYYNTYANRDADYYRNVNNTINNLQGQKKKEDGGAVTAIWIIVAVLTSPIWLTLLLALVSVIFGVIMALIGLAIGAAATMAALVITGFVLAGVGIGFLFSGAPAVGFGLLGGGLIVLALGVLAVVLVVWVFGWFIPWALKGIYYLCRKPFDKRKERVTL